MRTLISSLFFCFFSLTNSLWANPILADSCTTIVWKSGKTMSIRVVEKTDSYIKYSKCNEPNVVYKADLSEFKNVDQLKVQEKKQEIPKVKKNECDRLELFSGTVKKAKILEKTDKFVRYYVCDDSSKTEFTIPASEVKSINDDEGVYKTILKVADTCQVITWMGGNKLSVVVVDQDSTHFKYYKCSDKKKRVYTANNLELLSQADRLEARKSGALATLGMAFSFAGFLIWPLGIAGLIMGLIALINKKPGKKRAIWAIVIGGIITFLVILYIFLIFV